MDDIEKLREIDFEIHNIFEKNGPVIIEFTKSDKIPKTSNTFLLFITKTNFIKEAIFELSESQEIYSINILFRSLIEHFLRFQYMFFRVLMDKNDSIGDDYIRFCSLSENIDTGKAWKDVAKILDTNPTADPYEILKEVKPDYKDFSKDDIIKKAEQFRYKNIIQFINNKLNKDQTFERNEFLLKIIPIYSDLSSFVHGGPSADQALFETMDMNKRIEAVKNKVELAFIIAGTVKLFSYFVFYQYDKRLGDAFAQTRKLIDKTNAAWHVFAAKQADEQFQRAVKSIIFGVARQGCTP